MKILAGMDLASESVEFYVMNEAGKRLKRGKMSWAPAKWKTFVNSFGAENLTVAFETGPEGYRAKRLLEPLGVAIYPFHAANFPAIWRSNRKTDRIDAEKICRGLYGHNLPERVELAEDEEAKLRNLVTERELHMKVLRQVHNRLTGLARQWGIVLSPYRKDSAPSWWEEAIEQFPKHLRAMAQRLWRTALSSLQALDELEEAVSEQVEQVGGQEIQRRLETAPGVGPVVATAILAYLGTGGRIRSGRRFAAYLGMVPSVEQTGKGKPKLGHITKQGPSVLRRLLVQAARSAIRGHQLDRTRWKPWFQKLAARRGGKIAIVALARKIGLLCYALVRDGTEWEGDRLRQTAP